MTGFVPKAEYERVANSLQQLQAGTAAAEVDKALDEAIAAGKITPASRNFYRAMCSTDMKAFKDFVKSAPVVVQPVPKPPRATASMTTSRPVTTR
jgi:phage I-like protein